MPKAKIESILAKTMPKRCKACNKIPNIQEAYEKSKLMDPGQTYSYKKIFGKQRARNKADRDKSHVIKCAQSISTYVDSVRSLGGVNYPRNKSDEVQKKEREDFKIHRKNNNAKMIGVLQNELEESKNRLLEGNVYRDEIKRQLNECNAKLNPLNRPIPIPNTQIFDESLSVISQSSRSQPPNSRSNNSKSKKNASQNNKSVQGSISQSEIPNLINGLNVNNWILRDSDFANSSFHNDPYGFNSFFDNLK